VSRFREVLHAIGGPLDFAVRTPEGLARSPRVRDALEQALINGCELRVPPSARRRFGDALERLRAEGLSPDTARYISKRLERLRAPDFVSSILSGSAEVLPGVGPKGVLALARKELHCVEDLVFFWPRAYEDRRQLVPIEELQVGRSACFTAHVTRVRSSLLRSGKRSFEAVVADDTGVVCLKWFRGQAFVQDRVRPGTRLLVAGDVRRYRYAKELHHPEVELLSDDVSAGELARIIPVYPQVDGVPPRTLRRIVEGAVNYAADLVESYVPGGWVKRLGLPDLATAIVAVHLPSLHLDPEELQQRVTAHHRRLAAEELFLLQIGFALTKHARERQRTLPLAPRSELVSRLRRQLPFELTPDQEGAWAQIAEDVERAVPMNRLLLGDVGTGKTVVALLACAAARAVGGLSVLLAPTEVLAQQHARTLRQLTSSVELPVSILTGSSKAAERRRVQSDLRRGEVAILVGTHALLSAKLELPNLRLVVIDEQHRFGVAQRGSLAQRDAPPHQLVMTATPIPRTLAMALFSDLEHSELRRRPPGRQPVQTRVVPPDAGRVVLREIQQTIARGEQVYVVYPLVEESEKQDLIDATRGSERLRAALPEARVALVHGRQPADERAATMAEFERGKLDVLVATTVIEVGVDVPNATLLVVRHADRFGLAQLHQLRGRVGRGERPGAAWLVADPKGEGASRRLAILEASQSGFEIAEEDLRIRGAGAWLGTQQAGHLPDFKLADLIRHGELLPSLREAALSLVEVDPRLGRHPALSRAVERRWGRRLFLGGVA